MNSLIRQWARKRDWVVGLAGVGPEICKWMGRCKSRGEKCFVGNFSVSTRPNRVGAEPILRYFGPILASLPISKVSANGLGVRRGWQRESADR